MHKNNIYTSKMKKLCVFSLIFLLSFITVAEVVSPAQAIDAWTDITLPYTITQAGNYRIIAPYSGTTEYGLMINASNVVVDGQDFALSFEANQTMVISEGQTNILLQNINVTSSANGYSWAGFGFLACTDFTVQNCNVSKPAYVGLVLENCSDFNILDCNMVDGAGSGVVAVYCDEFDLKDLYVDNCEEYGLFPHFCNNFNIENCTLNDNYEGLRLTNSTNFHIVNCDAISNYDCNFEIWGSSNFDISSCNVCLTEYNNGIFVVQCENFTVTNSAFNGNSWNGFSEYLCNNFALQNIQSNDNDQLGMWGGVGSNILVENCDFSNNLQGLFVGELNNARFTHNNITNNGMAVEDDYYGGFQGYNINATIDNSLFKNNYDAIMIESDNDTVSASTQIFRNNVFQNNAYTFFFDQEVPTGDSNVTVIFTNNLVNDTQYVDPLSFHGNFSGTYIPFNESFLSLNGTIALGIRPYSNGPLVSGNFWAHPDGTGFSQTGTDADQDGFIDAPFELFGNAVIGVAYDYHPYSLDFDVNSWVPITLPAIITQPGNYKVAAPYSGEETAIVVASDNVNIDGQNYLIETYASGSSRAVLLDIVSNITIRNLHVENSMVGIFGIANNFTLTDSNLSNNSFSGVYTFGGGNVTFSNVFLNNNSYLGAFIEAADGVSARNCTFNNNGLIGFYGAEVLNTQIQNCTANNNQERSGIQLIECLNSTIQDCILNNNSIDGVTIAECFNFELSNLNMSGDGWGTEIFTAANGTIHNCIMTDNSQAIYSELLNNVNITDNIFRNNGLVQAAYCGGVEAQNSNCTIANNLFENNYDALMWDITNNDTATTLVHDNIFRDNIYTFFFIVNQVPDDFTGQKLYFYNNMINDTAYVDPICFNNTYSGLNLPFNNVILNLNTTLQNGNRIFGNPSRIGGNFWAYPNGTGPSQTGTDANYDGFIDSTFDLLGSFNNATLGTLYDYLPYSESYSTYLVFAVGGEQPLAVNQMSSVITLELQDAYGAVTSGVTVDLASSSTTGAFYSDAAGTNQVTFLTIPEGESTVNLYYRDTAAGTPELTATSTDVLPASTTFTINAHAEAVDHITLSPQETSVQSGNSVNYVTLAFDVFGNSWDVSSGSEYAVDGELINGNTVVAGLIGNYNVSTTYAEKTVSTMLTVTAGDVYNFNVDAPSSCVSGIPFEITLTAKDVAGNTATNFNGTVTLSTSQGTISPANGTFSNGVLTLQVTLRGNGSTTITVDDGNGHTGTSTLNIAPSSIQTIHGTNDNEETVTLTINGNITAAQFSGITLTTNQSNSQITLSFTLQGETGTSGYTNITISKSQIPNGVNPVVNIDGVAAPNQSFTEDSQNYYVYFTVSFSTHQLDITFTVQPAADFTMWIILVVVAVLIIAGAFVVLKRQRKH
ncbi:MAG: right-handed parallel beta-helix repeat-containing protein [Candidatus Bathyarchaeota archaeon]|nr:right-handed parallel beta-helix repeat-containing protein [Candidatus Bathyarchaeota archaeon]